MGILSLITKGKWLSVEKAKKNRKNIVPVAQLMEELGVRTTSTVGTYETEENPDKRTIDHYLAMQDNDGTVKAITRLFSMPIQSTPIKVIASANDKGEREFIETVFLGSLQAGGMTTSLPFLIADMTRAIFEGFRLYEKVPQIIQNGKYKGLIGWRKLAPRDSNTIDLRSDQYGGFMGARQRAYFGGRYVDIIIPPEKCVLFTFQRERHPLYGESILKTAYYHYDKKHKLYYLAHKKAEIDAVGLKILKLSKPTGEADVNAAEEVVDTIGINSRITLPPGFELEINRASSGYDVLPLIEHHDSQMTLSALSQAIQMGTKSTYGYTYGKGYEMQGEFIVQMLHSIMKSMEDTLNQWAVAPLIEWNFGSNASYPRIKLMPLNNSIQSFLLGLFEKLLTKDPTLVPQEFIDKLSKEAAEKLGFDLSEKENPQLQAIKAFENGKKLIADSKKLPAPPTDNKIKKEIALSAEVLKNEPNFLDHFEALGRDYANKRFLQSNHVVV